MSRVFQSESSNYFLLLGITLFMVVFGLVMVLSSSSVDSHTDDDNFFARFLSQGIFAAIGVPLMLVASRIPSAWWKRLAWPMLIASCGLQAATVFTSLGVRINQNKNWLEIGGYAFQPSELIKISLVLWLGMFVALKWERIRQWKYGLLPVCIVSVVAIGLVLGGGDLGTTLIMAAIVLGTMFFVGIPLRQLFTTAVIASGIAVVFAVSRTSRLERILSFLHPGGTDPTSTGWQMQQSDFGLARGGIFGVGLGNSTSKWNWLPAASTDFIFSIIGEELGLIGAIVVLGLFVFLAVVLIRIMNANTDPFARTVTAAVTVWLIGQALVNIGVVLGLVPTLGVPLPLISSGGTALISSLFGIGVVLSFTRTTSPKKARKAQPR
ncbi:putative lipid II flippase FtsW [Planctomonas sp. JC2975]|uniref:putative lipid II flippase FtsW n=1 Tax=Planctomonas sp. JC2975 TaxID=2729626 RepID=UPI00179E04D8|nr:putative lipid II flippase FtsW [Planctomonas sp. JC2975]NNC10405.1 putative lipid II flippase FtsW [Planctomonas sp. JC2975]